MGRLHFDQALEGLAGAMVFIAELLSGRPPAEIPSDWAVIAMLLAKLEGFERFGLDFERFRRAMAARERFRLLHGETGSGRRH